MCLDAGATGVIFSTIESPEQSQEIIDFCRYPLHNGKRGCGLVRENQWGDGGVGTRIPIIIGQIETRKAVDNLKSILKCGFDMFIIGPYDLSNSLGRPCEWENSLFKKYINKIYSLIPSSKLGTFLPTLKNIEKFKSEKKDNKATPKLVVWGMDTDFIKNGINSISI